jgi:dTDP-glucose pyrophosphorylase
MKKTILNKNHKNYLVITPDKTIRDALVKINLNRQKCLIVVDKVQKLKGIISDGNIRRGLLKGLKLEDKIESIYSRKNIIYYYENNFSLIEAKKKLIENYHNTYIGIIPIVNMQKKVIDFFTLNENYLNKKTKNKASTKVIIMAGGLGLRMRPFTDIFPKPLMPVDNKTVSEHIMNNFLSNGFNKFIFSLNYKSKLIKAFFQDFKKDLISIKYIEERKPLGTAGSLIMLKKKINKDFFVINCDSILNLDFGSIMNYHEKEKNKITIVASMKNITVPYGVCTLKNNGIFDKINEKPTKRYLVSTGLYVLSPDVLKIIPKNSKYDFNELIDDTKKKKMKVGIFPIEDKYWNDVGNIGELSKLNLDFKF